MWITGSGRIFNLAAATASRREGVYNRTGELSVTFHERGGTTERSKVRSDVALVYEIDAYAPQVRSSQKVVVSQRRYECVCKRIADAHVPFCEKGGARKRADVFLDKEKRSKANFAPTWNSRTI